MKPFVLVVAFSSIFLSGVSQGECQTSVPQNQQGSATPQPRLAENRPGHFGIGVKLSSLGLGVEAAVLATQRTNLRAGLNVLGYSHTFNKDGIPYNGHLNFKTFEAHYDIFPWAGSFHVSPGLLIYAADRIKATAFVPGNHTFTLGGVRFYSDSSDPTTAHGKINFNRAAPMITVGWGNLISRKEGSRFSVPFEIGVAFQGSPKTTLAFTGNVCESLGTNCSSAASNPAVQSNIVSEQNRVNSNLSFLKVYPIISGGFAVRF